MLYLFDLDGTLISSYMDNADRAYHEWEPLPGRHGRIATLRSQGHTIALATNQAGVAWGHVAERDVRFKLADVARLFGFNGVVIYDGGLAHRTDGLAHRTEMGELPAFVCYDDARAPDPRYHRHAARRKPSGAMIREAAMLYLVNADADLVLYVGDREEDETAAKDAGVRFQWAHLFFKEREAA